MKFIHTADWQIGKVFRRFGDNEAMLRQARLDAIETIGRLAKAEGASCVLVAGDVYDSETPHPQTLRAPLERMRLFPQVRWYLLPGNHDPHRPQGVWDRACAGERFASRRSSTNLTSGRVANSVRNQAATATAAEPSQEANTRSTWSSTGIAALRADARHVPQRVRSGSSTTTQIPAAAKSVGPSYLAPAMQRMAESR